MNGGGYSYSSSSTNIPVFGANDNLTGGLSTGGVSIGGGSNQFLIYGLAAAVAYLLFKKK